MRLDWKNGSQWWFRSWDNPESMEGANIDYIHLDEARLILHLDTALLTAKRRLRGSGRCNVPINPALWITTTTDKLLSVLFNELENPLTKNPESKIYRWSIYDNPFLPKAFIDAIVQSHTGGLAERFVYGRFANVGAGSFPFDTSVHVRDQSDKRLFRMFVMAWILVGLISLRLWFWHMIMMEGYGRWMNFIRRSVQLRS